VRQGRVGKILTLAVQAVRQLERGLAPGRERVQHRGAGVGVARFDLGELRLEVAGGLVEQGSVGGQAQALGLGQRPQGQGRGHAFAGHGLARLGGDPGPAAVIVLAGDQVGHSASHLLC
jgi:hypothetical protein